MIHTFSFDEAQFNKLFPFYILISRNLHIMAIGKSLSKMCDWENEKLFNRLFHIPRPFTPITKFDDLILLENQLVVLQLVTEEKIKLRGQFEYLKDADEILFVGSPLFGSINQVRENNLVLDDFAKHDPLIDLLHVMKSQDITNEDLKQLVATINKQRKDLEKANKEVHDIALFPMQNPDPLIRINFKGDILRNNPAAAKLDFFEIDKKVYRNDAFFKLVAHWIDQSNSRWIIEAVSNNRHYSFICVPMQEEGYINIYGRDISRQKIDQQKLERLSLVASANDNGVLFTTPDGTITWANEGFCKLTGYKQGEVIGKSPVELFTGPLTDETTLHKLLESFFRGEGFSTEIIYYRKDKSWFWGRSVSQPIKNKEGKLTEFFGIIQDVTEEKASEEKLKVLSQIAEDNINAVVISDKDGRITWVNKSFIEITGYTLEEAVGRKPGHLLQGPETDKTTVEYLRKQIQAGEPFNAEILNYSKTKNKYWLRVQGQPIKNELGQVTGFFALEEDITKERETEYRFKKALESIGDNVWEHDYKTGKTYFSKTEIDFLGYHTDEFTNNQQLWWSSVFEEDRHLLDENDRKYRKGEIDSHSLEYRMLHRDGSIKWVLDRGVVIEKDRRGNPLRITGTHTDITGRKEFEQTLKANEEKYRGIIANMNLGLMEMDINGKITFANQMLLQMTGLNETNIIGYDSSLFLTEESMVEVRAKMKNRSMGISEAYEVQTNINHRPGWWFVSSAPKLSVTGEHEGSIVICLDITNQKKLEIDLTKSREQAEQLAKAKETFLANMSHEIRTPMNAIMGMGNQLAKTKLTEQQNFYLNAINTAAENLLIIINDILDLSKIEAGKLSIEKIGFEPKKVFENALQVLMHKAEEKGLKLTNSFYDSRLSPVLTGDPYRLNQVLLNLMSNAIKFTEKGSVDITCEVTEETPTTQTIQIKVMDTGIGMEKEFVEKLFDKFSQEYESISRRYGGTGLGMSICKELVELMGGEIEVTSSKGKGTTILFRIKFEKGMLTDMPNNITEEITAGFLKGKTILITDDNDMNRLVASTILENYGAAISEAANGEEAIHALTKIKTDLVLMDIQMPVLNGYEAAKIIRKVGNKIPIIALTANAIKGENEKCIEAGMNDYISKPFKEEEFLKKIAHWLNMELTTTRINTADDEAMKDELYDLSGLKEISQGNDAFIEKMVKLFCEQSPVMVEQIKEAYLNNRLEMMGAIAHKLKPSIDNLKINSLKSIIRAIEKAGKENNKSEELQNQIQLTEEIINQTIKKLSQEIPA
ncbi:MAG: PAS domain S-box protein [Chitinophagaceae bacterium]|nr:PAS domain S-box protein [Chitinophagaceae bacterium]